MENEGDGRGWLLSLAFGIGLWFLTAMYFPHSLLIWLCALFFLAGVLYPSPKR